jgi:hypothetical protein
MTMPIKSTPKNLPEVFVVSTVSLFSGAQNVCSSVGAVVATAAQMQTAFNNGADWCHCTWTSDGNISYPINTTLFPSNYIVGAENRSAWCGGQTAGIRQCGVNNGTNKVFTSCYGIKPANGTGSVLAQW